MEYKKTYKHHHIPAWFTSRCYKYTGKNRNQIGRSNVVRLALTLNGTIGDPNIATEMFDHFGSFVVDKTRVIIMHAYYYPTPYELWQIEKSLDITITVYPIESWHHPECTVITFSDGAPSESQHWPEFHMRQELNDYWESLGAMDNA